MKFTLRPDLLKPGVREIAWMPQKEWVPDSLSPTFNVLYSQVMVLGTGNRKDKYFAICGEVCLCNEELTGAEKALLINAYGD